MDISSKNPSNLGADQVIYVDDIILESNISYAYTPSITGESLYCVGSTYSYTLQNLPAGSTVKWAVSDNASIISSTASSVNLKVNTSSPASAWVEAIIENINGTKDALIVRRNLILNSPNPSNPNYWGVCDGNDGTLCATPVAGAVSHKWMARTTGGTDVTLTESSDWCVYIPYATYLWVELYIYDQCGGFKKKGLRSSIAAV